MRNNTTKPILLIYILVTLLTAAVMAPSLSYLLLSFALLAIVLFVQIRALSPGYNVVIYLAIMFLMPLVLEPCLDRSITLPPVVNQFLAAIVILPVYYHLDFLLKEHARSLPLPMGAKDKKHLSTTLAALLEAAMFVILIALVTNRLVLLVSGVFLLLYLLVGLVRTWFFVPIYPFSADAVLHRIIAGTRSSITLHLTNRAALTLRVCLRPANSWVQVTPQESTLRPGDGHFNLNFTPPLAGQSCPRLEITAMDQRGFVWVTQVLEPLQLHIIPRAKYAEWLALKYLEQAGSGTISESKFHKPVTMPKRGSEYHSSRSYQPGDPLRNIDWKHTLKLSQLIVREFQETGEQSAILAINLSVTNDEEADELAFNLITAALTLAKENIPTALAAYDYKDIILSQGIVEPNEMLRRTLILVKEITIVKFADRYLEPVDITRIRRNISQLKQTESEPAQKLLDILNFEYQIIEDAAKKHPATLALTGTSQQVPAPALIILISQFNHDTEAILVTSEKLARRKYTTLPVSVT